MRRLQICEINSYFHAKKASIRITVISYCLNVAHIYHDKLGQFKVKFRLLITLEIEHSLC